MPSLTTTNYCAGCGHELERGEEFPANTRRGGWDMHAECADEIDEERARTCGIGEHSWPAELDADASCERPGCGLAYGDWSE